MTPQHQIDTAVGLGALSSPKWLQWIHAVNEYLAVLLTFGGVILVSLRIWLAIRQLKEKDE